MPRPVDIQRRFRLHSGDLYRLFLYVGVLWVGLLHIPNTLIEDGSGRMVITLGILGVWRYAWWLMHFVRAQGYARYIFPGMRQRAEALWEAGWRPRRVHFMLTTFREKPDTTRRVLASIVQACHRSGIPARIFVGTGNAMDEQVIRDNVHRMARGLDLEVVLIRQNQPGKRFAIGLTLRAMARHGVQAHDPVIFMDGDSMLEADMLRKCLPFLALFPDVDALTTDEKALVYGPAWVQHWLDLRFAQRHIGMQSWAVSKKLPVLTGRLSIIRGSHVVSERFIRTIEADHLNHWLWGSFRFLSGDDKSTWYYFLRNGSHMLYVPDAVTYTIEYIQESVLDRVKHNLLRWTGNTLRNGWRAIRLGPRRAGLFIWWCLVDQRIAIWTTLVGPMLALFLTWREGVIMLVAYGLWIGTTRLFLSLLIWYTAGRINLWFPLLLYLNQTVTAVIKFYVLFRLAKQRWRNRSDQRLGEARTVVATLQNALAAYITLFYLMLLLFAVALYAGILPPPSWFPVRAHISMWSKGS